MATILVIDDSDTQRAEICAALKGSDQIDSILEAADGLRGLRLLLEGSVDLVLCDLDLPGIDGEKLLRVKTGTPNGANVPLLFLTASTNKERLARLLEDGACDAISKPFHRGDLVARVHLHLKVKRLQDELMVKNATLARLSTVDALTDLRSRRYVMDCLSIEFLRARRYSTPLAILMADLDQFKAVNDEFGHPGGDAVLRGVAELLLAGVRATDVAGRYGGEELIVLLPQNSVDGAEIMAERWRQAVEETIFELPDGRSANVTVSIGIAGFDRSFETPYDLVAAADSALYLAKQKGRNRIEIHRADPRTGPNAGT
jgi:two-component system cell cycle response regulator